MIERMKRANTANANEKYKNIRAYESALKRFRPSVTAIIAPRMWLPNIKPGDVQEDDYFVLTLPLNDPPPEAAYMVRRAARELSVSTGSYGEDHDSLVRGFLAGKELSEGHRTIFTRISHYLALSESAHLLEARKGRTLVAFSLVDLGSENYGFYLFNFRSTTINVPGASDLLLCEMAKRAQAAGKRVLNLGLCINPGVRRFKLKWGAVPFLPCHSTVLTGKGFDFRTIVETLLARI